MTVQPMELPSWFTLKLFGLSIALIGVPGALGGLTNGISIYLKTVGAEKTKWPPCDPLPASTFFFAQAVSGLGGALAALLVMLSAKRFPDTLDDVTAVLLLATTGFMAGYIANRLLPAVGDKLEEQITNLKKKTDETDAKVEVAKEAILQAESRTKQAINLATELVRAGDYLRSQGFVPVQTRALLDSLSSLAQSFPTNRTLNILYARVYDEAAGDRDKAIQALRDFIEAKQKAGEGDDSNVAAAYWNIANYCEFEFKQNGNPALRAQTLAALQESLKRDSLAYCNKLKDDPDFEDLRKAEAGLKLLEECKPK
jgi:hypothetical protein